ncbi:uncharacterized protein LOC126686399 [Mercurialis annua]|uniref:uncharacterized protein LOC126686399 n=1 Tax=Mercurialis annua TaxID=3986 RepID=UPI00215E81C4|nr:uncharacterized protein LOC126686399 [Mercurialis annua]
MPIFTASVSPHPQLFFTFNNEPFSPHSSLSIASCSSISHFNGCKLLHNRSRNSSFTSARVSVSDNSNESATATSTDDLEEESSDDIRQTRRSADWKAARAYKDSGSIFEGRIEGCNGGGFLVRFYSLLGFLPFPQLSPSHTCKEPHKSIHDIAEDLIGLNISVKIMQADEENRTLIFSEKEANWSKFSKRIKVGDIFKGRVGSVQDFGAFVHLLFPDGLYHLTGLVHVSEVSWDLVHDVRDVLTAGQNVKVKIINIDRQKSRVTLSIKQLEEDPLLETLDKVIPQDGSVGSDHLAVNDNSVIDPLPGLQEIIKELLREDGVDDVRINRQGFEKRAVSQDLQLWLSNAPPVNTTFILLARAGRQVQEIQLTTTLDQEGIKKALQRALERIP